MWKRNNMVLLSLEYWFYRIFHFIPRLEKLRKKDKVNNGKFLRTGFSNDK